MDIVVEVGQVWEFQHGIGNLVQGLVGEVRRLNGRTFQATFTCDIFPGQSYGRQTLTVHKSDVQVPLPPRDIYGAKYRIPSLEEMVEKGVARWLR